MLFFFAVPSKHRPLYLTTARRDSNTLEHKTMEGNRSFFSLVWGWGVSFSQACKDSLSGARKSSFHERCPAKLHTCVFLQSSAAFSTAGLSAAEAETSEKACRAGHSRFEEEKEKRKQKRRCVCEPGIVTLNAFMFVVAFAQGPSAGCHPPQKQPIRRARFSHWLSALS